MSRINCHSAFQHYEMFHSRGGDVINIGSNNTSIFNFGGGYGNFGGGGFWGGFGLGLGNAVGSLFSGLFGGGMMNPFGMGGMFGGMGNFGFGMNPYSFNYASTTGGGGGSYRVKDDDSDGKGKVKDSNSNNADYAKLNKLFERKNNLLAQKSPKLSDLETLKSDIDTLAKNLDGNDDKNDKDYIAQLQKGLDDAIKKAKGDGKIEPESKPEVKPETKTEVKPENKTEANPATDTQNDVNNSDNSTPWSNVNAWNNNIADLVPKSIKLPDGYKELDDNDNIDNIERVADMSKKTKDITGSSVISKETFIAKGKVTKFPTYIAIKTDAGNTYNYKNIGMLGGRPIYGTPSTDTNQNVYVMCKDSKGKVVLLQLDKFSGYGFKDTQN